MRSRAREAFAAVAFAPAVVLVYYVVLRPPPAVTVYLSRHRGLEVATTVAVAAVAAYLCRRVVQALLRLCGL